MSPRWLLVTDVDDTLLGDADGPTRLLERLQAADVMLVLNSSRPVMSVLRDMEARGLSAAAVIGALGTEISWSGIRDRDWEERFQPFPREQVTTALEAFGPPHPVQFQGAAKVSHAIERSAWRAVTSAIRRVSPDLRVVLSGTSNVDVIPSSAGKTAGVRRMAARCGIDWDRVVTAGDASTDAGMLLAARGIAVGNATDELRGILAGRGYQASASHAAGIEEGLVHYGALTPAFMHHHSRDEDRS